MQRQLNIISKSVCDLHKCLSSNGTEALNLQMFGQDPALESPIDYVYSLYPSQFSEYNQKRGKKGSQSLNRIKMPVDQKK